MVKNAYPQLPNGTGIEELSKTIPLSNMGINIDSLVNSGWAFFLWEQPEITKLLMAPDADIDQRDNNGWTPLIWAARRGRIEIAKSLIERGAKIDLQDNEGRTPLIWAVRYDHNEIVELFIKTGADVNIRDNDGRTVLMYAAGNNHVRIAKNLIKAGLNVNIQDRWGHTALHHTDSVVIAQVLIDYGSDMEIKNGSGFTPAEYHRENGRVNLADYIERRRQQQIIDKKRTVSAQNMELFDVNDMSRWL